MNDRFFVFKQESYKKASKSGTRIDYTFKRGLLIYQKCGLPIKKNPKTSYVRIQSLEVNGDNSLFNNIFFHGDNSLVNNFLSYLEMYI